MFKLLEARDLFFKEKSLDDFDIDSEDSIFKSFYEILLRLDGTRIEDPDVEEIITDLFNDACYICTILLLIRRPALKIGNFRHFCVTDETRHYSFATEDARADEVLCMVYFLLMYCGTKTSETSQFLLVLAKHLKEHSDHSYETYEHFFEKCRDFLYIFPTSDFNQRILAFDEFDTVGREPDWKSITNHYNKKDIKEIVECWKDPQQRDIVIDDIVSEIDSNYYYEGSGYQLPIKWSEKTQEEMIDYVESLRLTNRSLKKIIEEEKRKRDKKYAKTNPLNDPKIYSFQIPFLIYDENNETIISRTAKGINVGRLNPYKVNWMEVTLYDTFFVTDLLKEIHSEFLMDVAQAIDDEEARHIREDGQYTSIASDYYGTGQGSDNFYSYTQDNMNDEDSTILATSIAEGILKNRKNAEKFQKKLETRQKKVKIGSDASTNAESQNDSLMKANIPEELAGSEYWKKIKEQEEQHEEDNGPKENGTQEENPYAHLNDPSRYNDQEPYELFDSNGETITYKTARELNERKLNPFDVDWEEVTLYKKEFIVKVIEHVESDILMDVAHAIDGEISECILDGKYSTIFSYCYGTGQESAEKYCYERDNTAKDDDTITAVSMAEIMLNNRRRYEDYEKKYIKCKDGSKEGTKDNEETGVSETRLSKLDEIIEIFKKGNWKQPATVDNITLLLNVVFGRDRSLLDDEDMVQCEKLWGLIEGGRNDRMVIVPANLAGFFSEENLLIGSSKEISNDLFNSDNQINNINKGNSNRCSNAFSEVRTFLQKYIHKIIRQA